ncbi:hypothetical protein D3C83_57280 [compost metagenome]
MKAESKVQPFAAASAMLASVSVAVAIGGSFSGLGSATTPLPRQCLPFQSNGSGCVQHFRMKSSDSRIRS